MKRQMLYFIFCEFAILNASESSSNVCSSFNKMNHNASTLELIRLLLNAKRKKEMLDQLFL